MQELEATACQWESLQLVVFASDAMDVVCILTYSKITGVVPTDATHCSGFAGCFKRNVLLNFRGMCSGVYILSGCYS